MKKKHPELSPVGDTGFADIASLIDQLSIAEEALRKAMENQVDAIMLPDGQPYMLDTARDVLQESQKALQASERRFRSLIENSNDVISLIDANGDIVYSSPSLTRVLGHEPEERIGHNIFENIHPDDRPKMKKTFGQLLQQPGIVVNETIRYLHKNGDYRYMEGYAKNLLDDPDVCSIVINFRDVTERLAYETEVQEKSFELNERIKELKCINQITTILENTDKEFENLLQEIVDIIPPAFQFPEEAGAKIELYNKKITTGNYWETHWALKKDIHVHGNRIGEVQICYLEKKPDSDEGPFLQEERNLINEIAYKLGQVCERKQIQDKLADNEQRLSNLIINLPGMVYRCLNDRNWTMQFISPGSFHLTGYTPEQFTSSKINYNDVIHPDDREKVWERVQRALDMQERYQIEYRIQAADGEVRWVWEQGCGTFGDDGEVLYLEGFVTDITERRGTREKLQNEVNFSNSLLNSLPGIVYCYDQNLKFLRWNKNLERVMGYTGEELAEMSPIDFFEGAERELISERISEVFAFGMSEAEAGIVTKDGRKIPYYFTGNRIEIDGVNCLVGVGIDMTELKQAENEQKRDEIALRTSETQLFNALKLARAAHWEYDIASNEFTFNDLFYAIFHTTAEEVGGYTMSPDEYARRFVHPDDIDVVSKEVHAAIETTDPDFTRELEHRFLYSDGGTGYLAVRILVVKDERGRTIKTYGVNQDITARKQAEQRLALLNFALDHAHEASYLMDEDSRFLDVNQEACRALGYTRQELLSMKITDIDPDITMEAWDKYWQTIKSKGNTNIEARHRRKDGQLFPVEITANYFEYEGQGYDLALARDISERKQAEEALLKNQRNLLKAQKLACLGNWEWYPQDNYVTGSEELFRIFAIEPQQEHCPLQEFLDRIHPEDQESVNRSLEEVLSGSRNDLNLEFRVVHPDGEIRHVIDQGESVFTAQNKLSHLFGVVQDVTEQILAEQTLRKSEFNLSEAQRIAQLGSWELDLASGHLHWSDEVYRIFNLGKEEFDNTYEGFISHVHPDDREYIEKIQDTALAVGNEYNVEHRIVWPDGSIRWVNEIGEAELDEDGRTIRFIGTVLDITERKQAEIALQNRDALLRAVGAVAKVGGWEIDVRTGQCVCTEEVEKINESSEFGLDSGLEYYQGESREKIRNALDNAIKHGEPFDLELEMITAKGNHKWIRSIAQPVMENRKVIRLIGSFQDITSQHILEEQLRQSQKLESIGQLTGGVAHDFNNLLTVILGNSELLADRLASNGKLQPLAQMIGSAAQRGAELTHRLLAFARKQALEPRAININSLLLDMQKLLRTTLGEQIDISFELQKDLWTTLVDPGQLENALLNLCINARDAMPKGGRLTLETENKDLDYGYADRNVEMYPGQYVMISVADTGCGIAQEHITQIFEPFFTTKEKEKGTGLGLSMVYGFIRQSGGYINVYSEPGQGTTVKMCLPRVTSETETIEKNNEDVPVTGGSETILLVEDDAMVRQYAQNQLLSLGYRVLTAEDGSQALAILRENGDIDLLFTDVVMPAGMNGPELAELALRERPELKVLFTSGYTRDAFTHDGRLEEGVQLLNKPYGRAELARRIRNVLDNDTGS